MKRKILSILVAVVMAVAAMPVINADDTAADLEIDTLAQLEAFRDDVNNGNTYEGKTVKLTADIDMSPKYGEGKESWTPIGVLSCTNSNALYRPFKGTFNGNSHTISNLYLFFDSNDSYNDENRTAAGFFGGNDGIIKNLNVSGSIISNYYDCAGGIAGNNDGVIEKCSYSGYIESRAHMGGIAGSNVGTITDCYNAADVVTAEHCGGGIVGTNQSGTILRCYNAGNLTRGDDAWSDYFGSIAGGNDYGYDNITDCYYLEGTYDIGVYVIEGTDPTTALTKEQFTDKSNFTNWDFDTIWEMDENLGRPVLRSNTEEPPIETHTHTLVHHEAVPATCTETGTDEYWKCEGTDACNKMFSDANGLTEIAEIPVIAATGHNYGAWSITTEPTFNTEGKAERICKNDNTHKEIIDLPALSDTTVWEEGLRVEPTEIFDGFIQYTSQYGTVSRIIHALSDKHFLIEYFNGTATVSSRDVGTYLVIFAEYDISGALVNVDFKDVTFETAGVQEVISEKLNENDTNTVRVMLWNSLTDMKPLCKADGN